MKDARAVLSRLDHQTRKLVEPSAGRASPHDLLTTTLTCHAVSQRNARPAASAAADLYGNDASVLAALASPGLLGKAAASAPAISW